MNEREQKRHTHFLVDGFLHCRKRKILILVRPGLFLVFYTYPPIIIHLFLYLASLIILLVGSLIMISILFSLTQHIALPSSSFPPFNPSFDWLSLSLPLSFMFHYDKYSIMFQRMFTLVHVRCTSEKKIE